jgi:putative hydrolases of HD superfamily
MIDEYLVDKVIDLGQVALQFGRTPRATFHEDGVRVETVTDHTVALGLLACSIAARFYPDLDLGLVAQFALAHDLVEVFAKDTSTLRLLTAEQKADKKARERDGFERLVAMFGLDLPWVHLTIARYESQQTREARFVKALDKATPKITHILNGGVSAAAEDMTVDDLAARYEDQGRELEAYAADFPVVLELRKALVERMLDTIRERRRHG